MLTWVLPKLIKLHWGIIMTCLLMLCGMSHMLLFMVIVKLVRKFLIMTLRWLFFLDNFWEGLEGPMCCFICHRRLRMSLLHWKISEWSKLCPTLKIIRIVKLTLPRCWSWKDLKNYKKSVRNWKRLDRRRKDWRNKVKIFQKKKRDKIKMNF